MDKEKLEKTVRERQQEIEEKEDLIHKLKYELQHLKKAQERDEFALNQNLLSLVGKCFKLKHTNLDFLYWESVKVLDIAKNFSYASVIVVKRSPFSLVNGYTYAGIVVDYHNMLFLNNLDKFEEISEDEFERMYNSVNRELEDCD